MIITIIACMILVLLIMVGIMFLSIGGTFFTILAADLIVAIFVLYWVFFGRRKKSKRAK